MEISPILVLNRFQKVFFIIRLIGIIFWLLSLGSITTYLLYVKFYSYELRGIYQWLLYVRPGTCGLLAIIMIVIEIVREVRIIKSENAESGIVKVQIKNQIGNMIAKYLV